MFVELVSRYALLAGFVFAGLKLIATILQILFAKGDYRRLPDTVVFRTVYIVGKVTPALAAASFCALPCSTTGSAARARPSWARSGTT